MTEGVGSPFLSDRPARTVRTEAGSGPLGRIAAGAAFALLLPVTGLTAALIRLTLGPPVLFRQRRSGFGGRTFTLVKLRTMSDRRDASGVPLPDCQRLNAFGRTMRRFRLDEVPQLLSIARGDMSWIGPRPLLPQTVAAMGERGRMRGLVPPGLTGWAQVNGNTLLSEEEKTALDLWYAHHASARLDLAILFLTAATVLRGERRHEARIAGALAFLRRLDGAGPR